MDQLVTEYYNRHRLDRFIGPDDVDRLRLHRFESGETICELEQPIEHLYFFVDGRAKVTLLMENTRQLLLCFYAPLQIFGDIEIFEPEPTATTTIEALTPCVCLGLSRAFVVTRMAEDPAFLRQLCLSLGRKLNRVIRNSALNMLNPLENRVASYILATMTTHAEGPPTFSGNLTQIAEMLGTSFRHLHRTLQSFCTRGILAKKANSYFVQEIDELKRRAADVYVLT